MSILQLRETMRKGVANDKYAIPVFADLQGAFDEALMKGAVHNLHRAGITNNLLSVFTAF